MLLQHFHGDTMPQIVRPPPTQPCTLRERFADLEAQKDLALSTDVASPD
jgi:hypothetical protein